MAHLIFFDINGTIIERDQRTDSPYFEALNELLLSDNAMAGVNNAARSDLDVFKEVLLNHNIKYTDALWASFLDIYENKLKGYVNKDIWRINKDAKKFITKLSKTDHKLGLITGELSLGAKYKLKEVGVWQYFHVGGFGEDDASRLKIAESALKKANNYFDEEFDNVYVIGDTIRDILTARHINAKIISIATGANTKKELKKYNPDFLIKRFRQVKKEFY